MLNLGKMIILSTLVFGVKNPYKLIAPSFISVEATYTVKEDLMQIKVGEELGFTKNNDGVVVSSEDSDILTINENKIVGTGYGLGVVDVTSGDTTEKLPIIVNKDFSATSLSQANKPSKQGENNLYVYHATNGDIEENPVAGLSSLTLIDDTAYNSENAWWSGTVFLSHERVYTNGIGALSYKAASNGNYTLSYSAWLKGDIRTNADYMNWKVDGFSTGIAKKSLSNTYEVLKFNKGTKESVHDDLTRYQMGSVTLDLLEGEEIMFFFASNGNGDADEINTEFHLETNSINTYDGSLSFDEKLPLLSDVGLIYKGKKSQLKTNYEGDLTYTSSNPDVVSVSNTGEIEGKEVGSAIITASEGAVKKSLVVACRSEVLETPLYSQERVPTRQGDNNFKIYYSTNGAIQDDIKAGLEACQLMEDSSYNTAENSWWNGTVFVNKERVFAGGTGIISFVVPEKGNYRMDYYAFLQEGIRKNGDYMNWAVDGFSVGLAKKDLNNKITVLDQIIGTKESVIQDATRFMTNELVVNADVNEELMFWFISNGIKDCDEINTNYRVQRIYLPDELKPVEITLSTPKTNFKINEEVDLDFEVKNNKDEELVWASSNTSVCEVSNGKVTAKGIGYAEISLTVGEVSEKVIIIVDGSLKYVIGETNISPIPLIKEVEDTLTIKMDNVLVSADNYEISENALIFKTAYLDNLDEGVKQVKFNSSVGTLSLELTIERKEEQSEEPEDPKETEPTPETKKKGCAGDIIGSTFVLGIALITLAGLVIKKGKNN